MSLGSIWLRIKSKLRHGLRVSYWREIVRPRILSTPPVDGTTDKTCEIHCLTSSADWVNLVWALKTFYRFSGRKYALCIHTDPSVEPTVVQILQAQFPMARIVSRAEADARLADALRDHPASLAFRNANQLAPKVFDFAAYLEADRMLVLDSDVLFFDEPTELIRRIEDPEYQRNCWNADVSSAYTVDAEPVRSALGFELLSKVNTGLGLVHRESIRWDWTEEFLALPGITDGHFWRIEQTLHALSSSRFGAELLPEAYALDLEPGIAGRPFRHYVGAIRHLMYVEGIRTLTNNGILTSDQPSSIPA